jgi:hypothetical protein
MNEVFMALHGKTPNRRRKQTSKDINRIGWTIFHRMR